MCGNMGMAGPAYIMVPLMVGIFAASGVYWAVSSVATGLR